MKLTEEQLMAYADGELDAQERAAIAAAVAADAALAARVAQHQALRGQVFAAFAPVLDEGVPVRLQALVSEGKIAQLRAPQRRWQVQEWGALAAMLVLSVMVARSSVQGGNIALGELDQALTQQASGQPGLARMGLSFIDKQGHYCRSFTAPDGGGLACRHGAHWRVDVRTFEGVQALREGQFRMAASELPAAVLSAVDDRIAGASLDADAEHRAIAARWRP